MMTMPNRLLVGTALCLLMAAPAGMRAEAGGRAELPPSENQVPLILAQAEEPGAEGGGEDCPPGSVFQEGGCVLLDETAPSEEAPPEEMPPEAEEPAPEAVTPEPEPAPMEEAAPEQPAEPEAEAPAEEQPEPRMEEQPPAEEPTIEEQTGEEAQPPVEEAEPEAQDEAQQPEMEEAPADDAGEEQPVQTEEPPATPEAEAPEEEAPATEECPPGMRMSAETGGCVAVEEEAPPAEEAPAEEVPAAPEAEAPEEEAPATEECPPGMRMSAEAGGCVAIEEEAAPAEETPAEEAPAGEPAEPDVDAGEVPAEEAEPLDEVTPDVEQQAEPSEAEEAPPEDAEAEREEAEEPAQEAMPEDAAPVLDSQKEEGAAAPDEAPPEAAEEQPAEGEQPQEEVEETVAPESDEQAQQDIVDPEQVREEIRALVQEEGQRIELGQTPEDRQMRRREMFRPHENARVIEEYNDNRTIVEINNRIFIENPDYDRIVRRGDQVYYDELGGGRVREVIEREDGTRIVTVRNRYGDILRRVRVMPDGREYILAYVPDDRIEVVTRFEDPALDLPPLRLTIPESEYILEAEAVHDPERYYTFLHQPPVEPVRRLYSLEEVQYSARVRDMVRRIDLDTIEFEFGSAQIQESEIRDMEALATALQRLLEENPAETFLIEGHTDAVGSETANLALSDRRAEAVAQALTNVFGIPPENLVTQGYGEQYLKVNTQEPARENRRVAVRRITPLVSPVASRQ